MLSTEKPTFQGSSLKSRYGLFLWCFGGEQPSVPSSLWASRHRHPNIHFLALTLWYFNINKDLSVVSGGNNPPFLRHFGQIFITQSTHNHSMDPTQGSPYLAHQTVVSSSPPLGPDRFKYKPGSPLGPYTRPAPGQVAPTIPDQSTSSAPTSPYPDLDKQQIKKFHAAFAKTDAKVDNLWELLSMSGVEMAKQEVVDLITKWADLKPEVRIFSRLTAQDSMRLCKGFRDSIFINDEHLASAIPDSMIPPEFLPTLLITRMVSSRNTEMGTRNVIDVFLNMAVYVARKVFQEDRLVIHHKWDASPVEIPGIGAAWGATRLCHFPCYGQKGYESPPLDNSY